MPKIVKSSSSTEKAKLEILYILNKGSPMVIKSHEDSENINSNSNSKSSSKISFWASPDLSPEIEKLFDAMNLCDGSK
jgi:UDP-glucose 6-dehydrogenase